MAENYAVTVELNQIHDYEFNVKFGLEGVQDLLLDEPEPLGHQKGPSASSILAAAVANCLSASLVMCLSKSRIQAKGIKTTASVTTVRNESKRLRIGKIDINIDVGEIEEPASRMERCFGLFEQFCVVTASVKQGIPVNVTVSAEDKVLYSDS